MGIRRWIRRAVPPFGFGERAPNAHLPLSGCMLDGISKRDRRVFVSADGLLCFK